MDNVVESQFEVEQIVVLVNLYVVFIYAYYFFLFYLFYFRSLISFGMVSWRGYHFVLYLMQQWEPKCFYKNRTTISTKFLRHPMISDAVKKHAAYFWIIRVWVERCIINIFWKSINNYKISRPTVSWLSK